MNIFGILIQGGRCNPTTAATGGTANSYAGCPGAFKSQDGAILLGAVCFMASMTTKGLSQVITGPIYCSGQTLDLVILFLVK